MLQQERHEKIINYVTEHNFLSVDDAIRIFSTSPATIRRDFNDLAHKKLVSRVRGGIKLDKQLAIGMVPFTLREIRYSAEKELLAKAAIKLLQSGNVVFIDGGTTTFHLAMCLPDFGLRVITNSLRLASYLEEKRVENTDLEIYLAGGFLYPNSGLLLGPNAVFNLSKYHASWSFLSAEGINSDGLFNSPETVVEAERVMIDNSDKVVVLADHSKLGKRSMCHVCGLDKVDILITDECPEKQALIRELRDANIEVIEVPPPQKGII